MENANRVEFIDEQIKKCNKILSNANPKEAAELILHIKRIFYKIRDFSINVATEPDNYFSVDYDSKDNLKYLEQMIDALKLYRAELSDEQDKELKRQSKIETIRIDNHNSNTANAIINQNISIDSTIKAINELPNDILDEKDKKCLENILRDIDDLKGQNKEKAKNKIFEALKYIVDKGVEVGIAILPYLGEIARLLKL